MLSAQSNTRTCRQSWRHQQLPYLGDYWLTWKTGGSQQQAVSQSVSEVFSVSRVFQWQNNKILAWTACTTKLVVQFVNRQKLKYVGHFKRRDGLKNAILRRIDLLARKLSRGKPRQRLEDRMSSERRQWLVEQLENDIDFANTFGQRRPEQNMLIWDNNQHSMWTAYLRL